VVVMKQVSPFVGVAGTRCRLIPRHACGLVGGYLFSFFSFSNIWRRRGPTLTIEPVPPSLRVVTNAVVDNVGRRHRA
jgi:hypothetical protein